MVEIAIFLNEAVGKSENSGAVINEWRHHYWLCNHCWAAIPIMLEIHTKTVVRSIKRAADFYIFVFVSLVVIMSSLLSFFCFVF